MTDAIETTPTDAPVGNSKLLIAMNKLGLEAPSTQEGRVATLVWNVQNNYPRVSVFTHDIKDEGPETAGGRITANLDFPVFYSLCEMFRKLASSPKSAWEENGISYRIDNDNFTYENNVRSEKPTKVNELWVGRDKEGSIWISVLANNRPKIRFHLAPSNWHHFHHGNGTPLTKSENSEIFAKGYARMLETIAGVTGVTNYAPYEKPTNAPGSTPAAQQPQGQNQGSGNGWQQRSGGGGWQGKSGGGWQGKGGGGGAWQGKSGGGWQSKAGGNAGGNNNQSNKDPIPY